MVVLTEVLPESSSSSSSTHHPIHRYDVFLSFRGADTRNGFTDHLYNTLLDAGIVTFLDDEEIETGKPLKPELESAIKSSRTAIIVLSKNYASSTWCLDELVLILEQQRNFNQIVIPIFYHVEPTHVRKQEGSFGEAMAKHKQRMETQTDADKISEWAQKMEIWKKALTQVADLKGKDAMNRKETEFIKEVVTDIHHRVGLHSRSALPPLIGMDYNIEIISSWLTDESGHTADILTIDGMGGIGKTSLAKYVFQLHSSKFHKSSFIEGINARCKENFNGLLDIQKQLYGDISKRIELKVNDTSVYTSKIEKVLARKKVLIVLDDIGSFDQLDALLGNNGLHPGSKVIIATKDASLTQKCALFNPQVQPKHKKLSLHGLYECESLELLCINAFKSHKPKEGYKEVSKKLVKYCKGHPLALQVLGRSLQKQDVAYWEECIEGLMKEPHSCIKTSLETSIDTLPSENIKDLFKHIACFFVGMDIDVTKTILNACDINTKCGIPVLIDRFLLSIGLNNELVMHPLVQDMGRDSVRQESPKKPWKRSRLWSHEESFKVLKQKKGKETLIGLALDMRMLDKKELRGSFEMKTDSLSNMDNLMLLQLNYVQLNGCFDNFPEELRWLCMHGSPLKSIPLDLPMDNLVALDMTYSNIESFDMSYSKSKRYVSRQKGLIGSSSKEKPLLGSLKILDLSFCEQLCRVSGFFELPLLERLIISNCTSLVQVCESIGHCVELVLIDLSYCRKLKELPRTIGKLKKVITVLSNGIDLSVFPMEMINMDSLETLKANDNVINSQTSSCSGEEVMPRSLRSFISYLPKSLLHLSLTNNNLSDESFPMDFSSLSALKKLYLDGNPIVSMPSCVSTLPKLELLSMNDCLMLKTVARPPPTLRKLELTSFQANYSNFVSKILFHPEMSLLDLKMHSKLSGHSSFEIQGMIKIQPMADVEEKVLRSLGWTYLPSIQNQKVKTFHFLRGPLESHIQMYYEFGIFSTFYWGEEIPNWISYRSEGSSISFTIPSSSKKLRGLNICSLHKFRDLSTPLTVIRNITKNHTWIYNHYIADVYVAEKSLIFLSHWMFGKNEMEDGDQLTISISDQYGDAVGSGKECGFSLLYEEEEEEEEDALGYYKSWNHIIGGDLSAFQLTTGEYILHNDHFLFSYGVITGIYYLPFVAPGIKYKEPRVRFRPFSLQKSVELGGASKTSKPHTTEYVFLM